MIRRGDVNGINAFVIKQLPEVREAGATFRPVKFIHRLHATFDAPVGDIAHRRDLSFGAGKKTILEHVHAPIPCADQADRDPIARSDRAVQTQRGRGNEIRKRNGAASDGG